MDFSKILEYQKVDGDLYALETKLARSENKKKCIALSNLAKDAQAKSSSLEDKANDILKEFEEAFIADNFTCGRQERQKS